MWKTILGLILVLASYVVVFQIAISAQSLRIPTPEILLFWVLPLLMLVGYSWVLAKSPWFASWGKWRPFPIAIVAGLMTLSSVWIWILYGFNIAGWDK